MAQSRPSTHRAALLRGAKTLKFEQIETPTLQPHEVSIAPRATGICGTDLHYYQNGRNGIYTVKKPLVLGHEASGEIIAVGSSVTDFKVGDRVVFEPQLACQSCQKCRSGHYNLCKSMRFNGSASADPPAQGSLQEMLNHPASLLPDNLSFSEGALVEPFGRGGLAVRAHSQDIRGRIGHMVDVDADRLTFAKEQGLANATVQIPFSKQESESVGDFIARVAKNVRKEHGEEADLALECTGIESSLNICIESVVAGAKVVLVGMGAPRQELNLGLALVREIEILPIWRYTNTFQAAIDLIAVGMVDVKPMITHTFDVEKVVDALDLSLSRPANLIKCVITSSR
ncbi:l-iditol 2-dehydrogenase [Paraphaeosphaeria sporulosa]